ncbi:uncharacterized protein LOC62_01G000128 [Vanrija pseudolonga]|uniref:Uncharacterized protein n=1 Tax=Vanrija pseudolonga TaxID=143232 RepID=A0AAF0XYY5_9TREE|nr:hypothetical protein LOC62_01G000128 [Vanrija pseudolonga]
MAFGNLFQALRGKPSSSNGRKVRRRRPRKDESFLHLESDDEDNGQSYEMTTYRTTYTSPNTLSYCSPAVLHPKITVTDWNDNRKDEVWGCTFDYLSLFPPQLINPHTRALNQTEAQWRRLHDALSVVARELMSWQSALLTGTAYEHNVRRYPSAHPASTLPTDREIQVLIRAILWFRGCVDAIHRWDATLLAPHVLPTFMSRLQRNGPDRESDRILKLAGERLLHVTLFVERFAWFVDHKWPPSTYRRPTLASAFKEMQRCAATATSPFQDQLWAVRGVQILK